MQRMAVHRAPQTLRQVALQTAADSRLTFFSIIMVMLPTAINCAFTDFLSVCIDNVSSYAVDSISNIL